MYTYTWYQWLTFFYLYCFLGWIFESSYVSILQHRRSTAASSGSRSCPFMQRSRYDALVSLPFSGQSDPDLSFRRRRRHRLEYLTGLAMESLFKIRYWDYSHKKYNVHGYICLEVLPILGRPDDPDDPHRPTVPSPGPSSRSPPDRISSLSPRVSAVFLYDTIVCHQRGSGSRPVLGGNGTIPQGAGKPPGSDLPP